MTTKTLTLEARLGLDKYEIDAEQSHITIAVDRCAACTARPCLSVCPAQVYTTVDGHIAVRYENCLECGTCQLACDNLGQGGLTWRNPPGGFGIHFRYG